MFESISGQNSANLRAGRKGRQSYHTSTYFFPFRALRECHRKFGSLMLAFLDNVFLFEFLNAGMELNEGRCFKDQTTRQVAGQSAVDNVFHLMQT